MASGIELKQLIDDESFIVNMNKAFADLRADYELAMDTDRAKIEELKELHVDVKNQLSDLALLSRKSSGTICGLRGTGKTHLLLLARDAINSTLWRSEQENNLCIYLNMKRLCLPKEYDEEVFNRVFSIFIYEELAEQLLIILNDLREQSFFERLKKTFDRKNKEIKIALESVLNRIGDLTAIARSGNESLDLVGMGEYEKEAADKRLKDVATGINMSFKNLSYGAGIDTSYKSVNERAEKFKQSGDFVNYLNIKSVRTQLKTLIQDLNLSSITFYVDEWEKISYREHCQEFAAAYIDQIIDDPLYFWISIVPYRGSLYHLDNGADLQHQINLDESLIYENSTQDRNACLSYFKDIINKRLNKYFPGKDYTYSLLFNNDKNLSLLVLASMGNTRDFGTMLLKSWMEFQAYINSPRTPGRPYKYISRNMVVSAIKDNGDKKYSNIENESDVVKVWNDIKRFCLSKQSSHFSIEEKMETSECLSSKEFSELIYHRLIHLRKAHVPAKDADVENKLSIYAINYAATYTLHSQDRKMSFYEDYDSIHNKVRRYIYDPTTILGRIRKANGLEVPCKSCKMIIRPDAMKHAWEKNTCPYCGGQIYN